METVFSKHSPPLAFKFGFVATGPTLACLLSLDNVRAQYFSR